MNSGCWRSVVSVLSGTTLAQGTPFGGSLVIAHLDTSTEFGVFSAWLGVAIPLAIMLTCHFDLAYFMIAIAQTWQPYAAAEGRNLRGLD